MSSEASILNESAERGPSPRSARDAASATASGVELIIAAAVLLLLNAPLFLGHHTDALSFQLAKVQAGEWWRVLAHPFVHVSCYHFILDAAAFLFLYASLPAMRLRDRLVLIASCGAGSLLAAFASPHFSMEGLRGLSGIAHGLMAGGAMLALGEEGIDRTTRRVAAFTVLGVGAKCLWELLTVAPMFGGFHLGSVGTPIVHAHLGGFLGAMLACTWKIERA